MDVRSWHLEDIKSYLGSGLFVTQSGHSRHWSKCPEITPDAYLFLGFGTLAPLFWTMHSATVDHKKLF
jgi:hypothetical protein